MQDICVSMGRRKVADQVIMQAVQQQPEQLLSVMLAPITEVGPQRQLRNAVQKVCWVHGILVALGIHLHPYSTFTY